MFILNEHIVFRLNHTFEESEIDNFGKSLSSLSTFASFNYNDRTENNHEKIFQVLQSYNYTVDTLMKEVLIPLHQLNFDFF